MDIKLMSYNIQSWDMNNRRKVGVIDLIKKHNPDIICIQEITIPWFTLLKKELGDVYIFTGRDRYHGDRLQLRRDRERNCVLYKKDKFSLIWSHTYWLGPDMKHASKFEESKFNRIFTIAYLLDRTSHQKLKCISTHFDCDFPEGRKKQAEVLSNYLKTQKGPLLLAGDLNSEPKEMAYQIIAQSLKDVGEEFKETNITYHAYDKFPHERIDYIFRNNNIYVKEFRLVKDVYEGLPPSDHYPVECLFQMK